MSIKFEEIVSLIDSKKFVTPTRISKKSFVFVSNEKWTNHHIPHYYELVSYLEKRYSLLFEIIGGGKSCSKLIAEFSAEDQKVEKLLKIFATDEEAMILAKNLDLKYLIHVSSKQSLDFDSRIITETAPYYINNIYDIYLSSLKELNIKDSSSINDIVNKSSH